MSFGEFALSEFLSMLEDDHYRKRLFNKWKRGIRYAKGRRMGDRRQWKSSWAKNRVGWGEKRKVEEDAAVEIRRLREY